MVSMRHLEYARLQVRILILAQLVNIVRSLPRHQQAVTVALTALYQLHDGRSIQILCTAHRARATPFRRGDDQLIHAA